MENTSIDRLCESFLQTINQYNALEKKTHTYDIDPQIYLSEIFCKNRQNLVKQRITPHFLTTDHPNYYEFTTKG